GFAREEFLILQIAGVIFFGIMIPVSAVVADRKGRLPVLIAASLGIALFGLTFEPLFGSGSSWGALASLSLGLGLLGRTSGPRAPPPSALFLSALRCTGASGTCKPAGIVGASLAPDPATWLAPTQGIALVGYCLSAAALVSLAACVAIKRREVGAEEAL